MKTLIVEDDFTSRMLLQEILKYYGSTHIAVNGLEAVMAVRMAMAANEPYDLICLDIMLPGIDGHAVLKEIRAMEEVKGITSTHGVKIVMTSALNDPKNVTAAYRQLCDAYIVKPVAKDQLLTTLAGLKLIPPGS